MDIRPLTDSYAVSPQIAPEDLPAIAEAGYKTVICNRPDAENPPDLYIALMEEAAKSAGVTFLVNAFPTPMLDMSHVEEQRRMIETADDPVLAYCASGTRSTMVWSLAIAGQMPTDEILTAAAKAGYQLDGMRQNIDALAAHRHQSG